MANLTTGERQRRLTNVLLAGNLYKSHQISKKLTEARMNLNVDNLKIYLHINSFGGSVFASLATIDSIRNCKYPVVSIIEGAAASAATLISVVCHERIILVGIFPLMQG